MVKKSFLLSLVLFCQLFFVISDNVSAESTDPLSLMGGTLSRE